ncbi:hypothetical protein KFK09_019962 [Dendrobium nobile]|uniref:Uncharacterized protein n=1 Tax=Dendrobium nobile TaxID=94219 RepID=A0A8T3ASH7_DENNO|nr:hypothetical protein KFK09_019962 [Dendrobium nobile]
MYERFSFIKLYSHLYIYTKLAFGEKSFSESKKKYEFTYPSSIFILHKQNTSILNL